MLRRRLMDKNGRVQRRSIRETRYRKNYRSFDRRLGSAAPRGPVGDIAIRRRQERVVGKPRRRAKPVLWEVVWTGTVTRGGGRPVDMEVTTWVRSRSLPHPKRHLAGLQVALESKGIGHLLDAFSFAARQTDVGHVGEYEFRYKRYANQEKKEGRREWVQETVATRG